MLIRITAAALWLTALAATASAQSAGAAATPAARSSDAPRADAARRDGALMTHGNEERPKAGHSETSAGKSGK